MHYLVRTRETKNLQFDDDDDDEDYDVTILKSAKNSFDYMIL